MKNIFYEWLKFSLFLQNRENLTHYILYTQLKFFKYNLKKLIKSTWLLMSSSKIDYFDSNNNT